MRDWIKNVLSGICLATILADLFIMIGTAGAVENDCITIETGIKRGIVLVIVMVIGVVGILKLEHMDDGKYDGL